MTPKCVICKTRDKIMKSGLVHDYACYECSDKEMWNGFMLTMGMFGFMGLGIYLLKSIFT